MIETTGVFVRLPLSEEQVSNVLYSYVGDRESTNEAMQKTILGLGTPVTVEDLYPVGYISENAICGLATGIYQSASISRDEETGRHDTVALVRLGSAQATIASLEAEVGRLREALVKSRDALVRVTDERSTSYQARNGRWVSIQGDDGERCDIIHSDITTDCYASVEIASAALKGPEA